MPENFEGKNREKRAVMRKTKTSLWQRNIPYALNRRLSRKLNIIHYELRVGKDFKLSKALYILMLKLKLFIYFLLILFLNSCPSR